MKQNIIICCGISGSGKSTYSTELCRLDSNYRRINRDDLRKQLVGTLEGYYKRIDINSLEKNVTELLKLQCDYLLKKSYNLIIDNTHLSIKYLNEIQLAYESKANITIKTFNCDLEVAKRRILKRDFNCATNDEIITDQRVAYINKQYQQYQELIKKL